VTPLRWVEIDLSAVAHNARAVRNAAGRGCRLMAVVKADAYGHGAAPVARAAMGAGADSLAVTYLEEAEVLRRAGVRTPVLVMGPVDPSQAGLVRRLDVAVMVDDPRLLVALGRAGSPRRPVSVHVKADLGLCRWGVPLPGLPALLRRALRTRGVRLDGVFAHPGYMVGKHKTRVEESVDEFLRLVPSVLGPSRGKGRSPLVHVADSAVMLDFPRFRLDAVRVGNLLYGLNPTSVALPLRNPWRACSRLLRIRRLAVGQSVGYGGEFVATHPMTVASVPVGYSHGVTLEPASRWIQLRVGQNYWGTVRGVRCPFVGRVGMSHALVDVSAVPRPRPGDVIQLPLRRTASSNWTKVYLPA
jgi:alanine racemase